MLSHSLRLWTRLRAQLWFKPACWSVGAVIVALGAVLANGVVPDGKLPDVSQATLQSLLTIIASSMLAVSTFSLSILVQAFTSAAGSATPRALRVIMADDNAQSAVATFIAAFIYAMIALLAMGLGYYGPTGRFVLLVVTILVVLQVIVMLIRWIRTLSQLGRMGHTVEKVEVAARAALLAYWRAPALGGAALPRGTAPAGQRLAAAATGHVQHVDVQALQELAASRQWQVFLRVRPGAFVVRGETLAVVAPGAGGVQDALQDEAAETLRAAVEIGPDRNFDQDPRFGLLVLGEIGQRAMSSAVNDPGSAIYVAGAITRALVDSWCDAHRAAQPDDAVCDRVFVPAMDEADLVRDAFAALQRDAAGSVEVHTRLIKLLAAIAGATGGALAAEARQLAWRGWLLAREHVVLQDERDALQQLAGQARGL